MDRDRDLFWNLIEPEHLKVRAFCRKLAGNRDDGDDLYQDALVCALTGFDRLKSIESFRAWFYRIVMNTFRNRLRAPWWKQLTSITPELEAHIGSENPVPVQAARRRLQIAFRALSAEDRSLVTLFEMEGWSISELAEMTGRSEGSIKVRLCRSRRRMRDALRRFHRRNGSAHETTNIRSENEICVVTKPGKD